MSNYDIEVLKNHLATKIGILQMKINNGEMNDDSLELINVYKEYETKGTTIEELKLLFDDVQLALN